MSSLGEFAKQSKVDEPLIADKERTSEVESKYSISSFASTRLPISTLSGLI